MFTNLTKVLLALALSATVLQAQDQEDKKKKYNVKTYHDLAFSLGLNNYLQGDKFPDATGEIYSLMPVMSTNMGIGSLNKTKFSRNFYLEWGGDVTFYNYRFEDPQTMITKSASGITFETDNQAEVKFLKSKLTASYINASLIPMIRLGKSKRSPRIGAGMYGGYRIGSSSKTTHRDGDNVIRNRTRLNYYLENLHYGFKGRLGYRNFDLFATYELSPLFTPGRGPELNVVSIGLLFTD